MSIESTKIKGIVINTMGHQDSLDDFLQYIENHIHNWADSQVLWDMTLLDFDTIEGSAVRNTITRGRKMSKQRSGLKTAFVVKSDLGFGMMRMFQMIAENKIGIEFGIFRDRQEALCWLEE